MKPSTLSQAIDAHIEEEEQKGKQKKNKQKENEREKIERGKIKKKYNTTTKVMYIIFFFKAINMTFWEIYH